MTDSDSGMQVRIFVSAFDSQTVFDLRRYVRKNIPAFIDAHYPQSLPRRRAVIEQPSAIHLGVVESN
ncbi:hypothetical protein [Asticcacaulis sp. AC466]|uniref:hypothetical protein n=1 Tax=Asticcacaulis sp. AC466 TaxID=1282362 RepID=UPI0012DDFCC9|nr:hypothetical protein [Asticcacaulis sp. AC466]